MSDKKLSFAFVGCGEIALKSATSLSQIHSVKMLSCFDIRPELSEDFSKRYHLKNHPTLEDLLSSDVDAVVVSTPHHLHKTLAIQVMESGKHCLTEKPLACSLEEADEMIKCSQQTKKCLSVFYPSRFSYPALKMKEILDENLLGKFLHANINSTMLKKDTYWTGGYTRRVHDDWRTSLEKSGGGVLMMNGSHSLDFFFSVFEKEKALRVYAEYDTLLSGFEVEDFVSLVLRMHDKSILSLNMSSSAHGGLERSERFYFEKGQISLLNKNELCIFYQDPTSSTLGEWLTHAPPNNFPNARRAFLANFCDAIVNNKQHPCSAKEARKSLEVVCGAYLSMKKGQALTFPL